MAIKYSYLYFTALYSQFSYDIHSTMICDKYNWIDAGISYSTCVRQILMPIEPIYIADGHQGQFLDMCENITLEKIFVC